MKYLTVAEYASEQGISVAAVYKKIKKDRIKTTKGERNNQKCTLIIDDTDIMEAQPVLNQVEQNNSLQIESVESSLNVTQNTKLIDFMDRMTGYIELAGQAKLLTDSEHQTKQQYFELVQEKAELKAEIKYLQEKLKAQENSKNSNWWNKL